MAAITQNILGQMSGRVGGLVFSSNSGGPYVKQYVKGVDAKSLQQQVSRQRFSVMAAHWRALSSSQKSQWKTFAISNFVAKHPKSSSVYSGYEAFVSLNTMLAVAYSSNQSGSLYSPLVDAIYGDFPPVNYTAPQSKFVPQIQDISGNAISFILSSASFTKGTGQILFTLDLCPAVQINPVVFKTPIFNIPLGFSVYFSMPFSGGRTTVSQKEAYLVGSVRFIHINSGWVTSNSLVFSIDTDPEYFSKCKYAFNVGHHIFVSVYAVSNNGQSAFVGRQLIFIS